MHDVDNEHMQSVIVTYVWPHPFTRILRTLVWMVQWTRRHVSRFVFHMVGISASPIYLSMPEETLKSLQPFLKPCLQNYLYFTIKPVDFLKLLYDCLNIICVHKATPHNLGGCWFLWCTTLGQIKWIPRCRVSSIFGRKNIIPFICFEEIITWHLSSVCTIPDHSLSLLN